MSSPAGGVIGIDFGTTNTVVATIDAHGAPQLARFQLDADPFVAFRSALSFHAPPEDPSGRVIEAGPWAIEAYLEEPLETRFIQSFKTHAASPLFQDTRILGRRYRFEDLLSTFLLRLRDHAGSDLGPIPTRAIVGRPVNFAGAQPDPALALERYETAFARLGLTDIRYAHEPVAAAFFFARRLQGEATVLVGDFGGGTSDFSVVRFTRRNGVLGTEALANAGVGVAGDAFDYRIIDHLVSPELGKGSRYRAFDNLLPIPNRYFTAFARWEQLALLRASKDMRDIRGLARSAVDKDKVARLIEILDDNHGYRLYQSVSRLKEALSRDSTARFEFEAGSVHIETDVNRTAFEGWIAPELAAIDHAVESALQKAGVTPDGIDRVFLTGGSSFVPAVRRRFAERFGEAKIESGGELVSIATGLAYIGTEAEADAWCVRANPGEAQTSRR